MLKQKILKTLAIVVLVSIAAVISDYVGSVLLLHKPQVFDGLKTLFIAVVICTPVGYYLVNQGLDLQRIKEELLESIAQKDNARTEVDLAHEKLRGSEARYRLLADNAPDMITESTLDGVLTYVSPASLAITGFAPEELVGQPSLLLMHPDDASKVRAMCQAVFASKGSLAPWPVEFRARHRRAISSGSNASPP
jgi:PAS domain S-box-containing protein